MGRSTFFAPLSSVRQLVHLENTARDADFTEDREAAERRLAEGNRADGDNGREGQLFSHAETLQILIIHDIVLGRRADRAADTAAVGL